MITKSYRTPKGADISVRELNPGYICTVSQGILGVLENALVTPRTTIDHMFMLYRYDPVQDDWLVIESIAKGVSVGWLKWYTDITTVDFYRPNTANSDDICLFAAVNSINYGRRRYDFVTVVKVTYITLAECAKQIMRGKRPWVSYTHYPPSNNRQVMCTELVNYSFKSAGFKVFDPNYLACPPNFAQWCMLGRLEKVGSIPSKGRSRIVRAIFRAGWWLPRQNMKRGLYDKVIGEKHS